MKSFTSLRSLLAGAVLVLAGCAATDDRYELPGLQGPPPAGGGGSTSFAWYYGPGDVPRLNAGPLPYYDPYHDYRYGGLPPRYDGPVPYGFGPYGPYATAPCRDSNRNGRCDAYEPRPPKPPKPSKPPRPGSPGDVAAAPTPPPPRAAPPKQADRGDERERPRQRLPKVESGPDR